jgi:hypothetical protein
MYDDAWGCMVHGGPRVACPAMGYARNVLRRTENVRAAQVGGSHGYKADAGKVGVRPHLYLRCGRRGTDSLRKSGIKRVSGGVN